ncbi:three prime repair exonuclease 2-like [Vanessa cardui]|uniref:three prime repair exonuclease 2-like n=1 Tax=Vanessa cardui TaxID=171605 RepID=UPI001F134820|nr:three prime repair exonuclease 2-like [Vanessa cardui]
MPPIATYVFLDLETTGLPAEENNKTKITELSLVAVKREHVLDTRVGATPRIQHKLTLCFNPGRMVAPTCTEVTGLCNDLLECESYFNIDTFRLINTFLKTLTKPVCLIAQNGHRFDFPILKNHFVKLGVSLSDDILCADCLHSFYDILEKKKYENTAAAKSNECDTSISLNECDKEPDASNGDTNYFQLKNEKTPERPVNTKKIIRPSPISKVRRRFPWSRGEKPEEKYKLKDIYERLLNRKAEEAHRAENDCLFALAGFVALSKEMVQWFDENHCLFSEVKPMRIGVPLGY